MRLLRQFTSVSTETGKNLILDPGSLREQEELRASAPGWVRALRPFWTLNHRLGRLAGGVYTSKPFEYSLFTFADTEQRRTVKVKQPTFVLPGRFGSPLKDHHA
jgi:hypothetical protein